MKNVFVKSKGLGHYWTKLPFSRRCVLLKGFNTPWRRPSSFTLSPRHQHHSWTLASLSVCGGGRASHPVSTIYNRWWAFLPQCTQFSCQTQRRNRPATYTNTDNTGTGNAHFADQGLSWGKPYVENKIMGCGQEAELKTVKAWGQRWWIPAWPLFAPS